MIITTKGMNPKYNNSSILAVCLFSLNTAAATLYLALMEYVAYFMNGIIGFGVIFTSVVLTGLRVFDGLIDPVIGFVVDKTEGRFGKFRPCMFIGNLMMAVSVYLMFDVSYRVPDIIKLPFFVFTYVLFVIGYTFQMLVSKSGQTVLTNNPKIRPITTCFDSLFITSSYGGTALYVQSFLVRRYPGDYQNPMLYKNISAWIIAISFLCTLLAMLGIYKKDRKEFYRVNSTGKVKIKDYISVIKENQPIRKLVIAASVNKFTSMVYSNVTVGVIIFGIMIQNYKLSGTIGLVTAIPNIAVVLAGVYTAQKLGQKKAFQIYTWLAVAFQAIMTIVLLQPSVNQIALGRFNIISLLFFTLYVLLNGCKGVCNNIVVPMIADCSDYEVYRSGKYVPGFMGAMFSLIDQVVSAFGTAFVGLVVAAVGFKDRLPQVTDQLSFSLKAVAILCYCIVPITGWLISLKTMENYELDLKTMKHINSNRKLPGFRKTIEKRK